MTLLMIPGPIELSPAVLARAAQAPKSHVSPPVIEAFGQSLTQLRQVWCASDESQPFIVAGSGTLAMDMAVQNVLDPGDVALVVNTGYFSDRISAMIAQRGATVHTVAAPQPGGAPDDAQLERALEQHRPKVLFATHVDTSTGVRVDAAKLCALAKAYGALTVFDGVCATAAEELRMAQWGVDIYLTASQKAIGLPAGLALMVASPAALEARAALKHAPMMAIDFMQWLPIMRAYEARQPSYFSTPATTLIMALQIGLEEILGDQFEDERGIDARFKRHEAVATHARQRWAQLGLRSVAAPGLEANTLSALYYPEGTTPAAFLDAVKSQGVIIAGGLHPQLKAQYFRVGHMGYSTTRPDHIQATLDAVAFAVKSFQ